MTTPNASGDRGRPPKHDREKVLMNLVLLFWEKGYEATTQQDMLKQSGLSASSLANSFGSKPKIFEQVLEHYLELQRSMLSVLLSGSKGIEDLCAFFSLVEKHAKGELDCPTGCLVVKTMTGPSGDAASVAKYLEKSQSTLRNAFRGTVERASRLGEISSDRISAITDLLSASMIGIMATSGSPGSTATALAMIDGLRTTINGLRLYPSEGSH